MNLANIVHLASHHFQTKPLLRYKGLGFAYADILDQTNRLTGALLARGIGPGTRVLVLARNKPEWLITLLAGLRTGALVVPVNPALTASEITYIVEHSKPSLVIVDQDLLTTLPKGETPLQVLDIAEDASGEWGRAVANTKPSSHTGDLQSDSPALMFYTSGTTGRPKGAVLSHGAEIFTAEMVSSHFRLGPSDISLVSGSLSFIYPLMINCLASIRGGATVVLQERFHPELALRAIESEDVTIFMGVPTMFSMMLDWASNQTVQLPSLRFCISAGQNLAWNVARRFKERFGICVYDLWGQTEGTPITSYDPSSEAEGRPESCGRALPGCAVRIIDPQGGPLGPNEIGEVLLAGPNVMLGYYENPTATAETLRDGWIYTGDLGKLDDDGYLYICGRKRDLVIRGGANIYPAEIEEAIYAHPAVSECAVIGVPDQTFGELVKAYVVTKPGIQLSAEEVIKHCQTRLAEYKVPSRVAFVDDLPKGPTGKILKRSLREMESEAERTANAGQS